MMKMKTKWIAAAFSAVCIGLTVMGSAAGIKAENSDGPTSFDTIKGVPTFKIMKYLKVPDKGTLSPDPSSSLRSNHVLQNWLRFKSTVRHHRGARKKALAGMDCS